MVLRDLLGLTGTKFGCGMARCGRLHGARGRPGRAQVEGAIVYALAAALYEEITLKDGRVQQLNFHDYTPARMSDAPAIEVHIVPSTEPPSGVAEPGVPPLAPAVANAIFAATGKRMRRLPFRLA